MKVFVDADTLLFSSAAVTEQRTVLVTHEPSQKTKEFKTRTEFKQLMKSKEKDITDYSFKDIQTPEPVENCLSIIKGTVNNLITAFDFNDVVFVAGDSNNFRLNLPLPSKYKGQREAMLRPIHLKESHNYLKKQYQSVQAVGYEADDYVAILAYNELRKGNTAVLLSPDKDSRQFVGLLIGDYSSTPDTLFEVKDYHPIVLNEKKKIKTYGVPWLAYQITCGDISDNYKPTELADIKYGDVSFYKDFVEADTPQKSLLKVIEKYQQWYPDKFSYKDWSGAEHEADWKSMLRLYFRCAKMMESKDDILCAGTYFDKYRIDL